MSKYIRASIKYEAMIAVDDSMGLFKLAEAVPELKDKLLKEVKASGVKALETLTADKLTFEEVIMPDRPTTPTESGGKYEKDNPNSRQGAESL